MSGPAFSRCFPLLLLLCAWGASLAGQTVPRATPATVPSPTVAESPHTPSEKELHEAQIATDSERLYQLAQQLKVEMDKSTKDTLSLSVIKKAAEIERLAHSLSDRMKTN